MQELASIVPFEGLRHSTPTPLPPIYSPPPWIPQQTRSHPSLLLITQEESRGEVTSPAEFAIHVPFPLTNP